MKRFLVTLTLLLALSGEAWAQVAFDAASNTNGATTSLSHNHTATGTNLVAYACVAIDAAADFNPAATYNSVSMDLVTEVTVNRYLALFRLVAPTTGSQTVAVTGLPGGGNQAVFVMTFTGVDQADPDDTPVQGTDNTTASTASVSSAVNDMVADCITVNNNPTLVVDGSQTEPTNGHVTASSSEHAISYQAGASPTVAMDWTWTGSGNTNVQLAFNINAAGGGGGEPCRGDFMMMGLGKCD